MTKTITIVCDADEGVIYRSIEEARDAYFSKVGEINEASREYAYECLERGFSFGDLVNAIIERDHSVFDAVRNNYYDYVSEQDEENFKDWLSDYCIVSDIEVEV